jgi:signal transduction histidine kinase
MIKPSRLFLKLFLAFWLATSLTFFVGIGFSVLDGLLPSDPGLDALLKASERLLQHYGVDSARQLLAVLPPPKGEVVGVYDGKGELLAGSVVTNSAFERSVIGKDGSALSLRSSRAPGTVGGRQPGLSIPLLIGTVMSALFSAYLAYYLAWPLAYLRRAMRDVAQGRFETRVKPMMGNRRDEIVDLAADCDRMANQLKLLVEAQQNLLHDISHELRSPLTRMQAAIGLLQQDPTRREMVARIERESLRMDTLIEALLTLARLQGRPDSIEREPLEIVELLAVIVENAQFEAEIKGCHVALQACVSFTSRASGELLYRCFENVIRNAVRFTAPGTIVLVTAQANEPAGCLTVKITDHGPGVDSQLLKTIFQPFERGTSDASTGFGLGLAIASRAIQLHGGTIVARNGPTGGLEVEVSLPSGI